MAGTTLEPVNNLMAYLRQNEKLHVAWCVTGIVGCLLVYGALQARFICCCPRIWSVKGMRYWKMLLFDTGALCIASMLHDAAQIQVQTLK